MLNSGFLVSFLTPFLLLRLVLNDRMIVNNESERMWKEEVNPNLRYYSSICLEELRKATKTSSQDGQPPSHNQGPQEYEAEVPST
jgi:hypothetical protein